MCVIGWKQLVIFGEKQIISYRSGRLSTVDGFYTWLQLHVCCSICKYVSQCYPCAPPVGAKCTMSGFKKLTPTLASKEFSAQRQLTLKWLTDFVFLPFDTLRQTFIQLCAHLDSECVSKCMCTFTNLSTHSQILSQFFFLCSKLIIESFLFRIWDGNNLLSRAAFF